MTLIKLNLVCGDSRIINRTMPAALAVAASPPAATAASETAADASSEAPARGVVRLKQTIHPTFNCCLLLAYNDLSTETLSVNSDTINAHMAKETVKWADKIANKLGGSLPDDCTVKELKDACAALTGQKMYDRVLIVIRVINNDFNAHWPNPYKSGDNHASLMLDIKKKVHKATEDLRERDYNKEVAAGKGKKKPFVLKAFVESTFFRPEWLAFEKFGLAAGRENLLTVLANTTRGSGPSSKSSGT